MVCDEQTMDSRLEEGTSQLVSAPAARVPVTAPLSPGNSGKFAFYGIRACKISTQTEVEINQRNP